MEHFTHFHGEGLLRSLSALWFPPSSTRRTVSSLARVSGQETEALLPDEGLTGNTVRPRLLGPFHVRLTALFSLSLVCDNAYLM